VSPQLAEERKQRLADFRAQREKLKVQQYLDCLANGVAKNDNLMPYIIDAVRAGATLEEMCNTLRKIWGEFDAKKS
ncbi:MAG: methylmalonyl-CoA mutase family protein, partial [candidate division WOR-3 bacterium]